MPSGTSSSRQTLLTRWLWFVVCVCAGYFVFRLLWQETFGAKDWPFFLGHAQDFVKNGQLYDRDLTHYAPAASIYKFPPLFASVLVALLDVGLDENTIRLMALAGQLSCYFLSIGLCLACLRPTQSAYFTPLAWIAALTFEPLFDNYERAQMETYLLLLLSLSLWYHHRAKEWAAGICIGIAAAIKIYPLYFAGYYLASRNYRALAGVAVGFLIALLFSLSLIHSGEHVFYFTRILPILLTENISNRGENISLAHWLLTAGLSSTLSLALCKVILLLPLLVIAFCLRSPDTDKKPMQTMFWLCLLTTTLLLTMTNSWWNYQILLLPPTLLALWLATSLPVMQRRWLMALLLLALLLIFRFRLGRLWLLNYLFFKMLDASALLETIFQNPNFLRGLATFLVLLCLLYLRCRPSAPNMPPLS